MGESRSTAVTSHTHNGNAAPRPDDVADTHLALTLDMERYLRQLKNWDIPPSNKEKFIETIWALLLNFADMGFGVHPVQLLNVLENLEENNPIANTLVTPEKAGASKEGVIDYPYSEQDSLMCKFDRAAKDSKEGA